MNLLLERRAEIAVRSLKPREQKQVTQALDEIRAATSEALRNSAKLHTLVAASGENLYQDPAAVRICGLCSQSMMTHGLLKMLWPMTRLIGCFRNVDGFEKSAESFTGLIVIGKDIHLSPQEQDRLKWRLDKTRIDSNAISCVSFNELSDDLDHWLKTYHGV